VRYASLISGGKDSCLAHHLAADQGFDPVAGIVIRPEDPESHMFHLPNLGLAAAQIDALGIERIEATAPEGKETELEALEPVFDEARRLGAETIVAGAVASEYQRVRVERAAQEAGLKTHTPLWHKDPFAILDELVDGAYDVRISAVAAMGFTEGWLGRRLDDKAREDLRRLHDEYRVHPIGEGGEYESLVLDAPMFERRIEVLDSDTEFARETGEWRVTDWRFADA